MFYLKFIFVNTYLFDAIYFYKAYNLIEVYKNYSHINFDAFQQNTVPNLLMIIPKSSSSLNNLKHKVNYI